MNYGLRLFSRPNPITASVIHRSALPRPIMSIGAQPSPSATALNRLGKVESWLTASRTVRRRAAPQIQ